MLLFGPFGGLVADRVDKRRLLFVTQSAGGLLALVLGVLVVTGAVQLWQVYLLAALLGVVNLFDNPARQTFVIEMVGRDDLPNAVSLNTVVMNASRVIGPAIGGLIITVFGLGVCFFVNAASYVAVRDRSRDDAGRRIAPDPAGCSRPGARSARGSATSGARRRSGTRCSAVALIGIFAYNFTVTLALLGQGHLRRRGRRVLAPRPPAWGSARSSAAWSPPTGRGRHPGSCRCSRSPSVPSSPRSPWRRPCSSPASLIVAMGAASIGFIATANATLQLTAEPAMRGRVMALYAMAFLGTTPIGAPLVGRDRPVDRARGWPCSPGAVVGGRCRRPARVAPPDGAGARASPSRADDAHRDRGACRSRRSSRTWRARPDREAGQPLRRGFGSFGSPSTRSPTMLRWISAVPPQMVSEREKKNDACRSLTG